MTSWGSVNLAVFSSSGEWRSLYSYERYVFVCFQVFPPPSLVLSLIDCVHLQIGVRKHVAETFCVFLIKEWECMESYSSNTSSLEGCWVLWAVLLGRVLFLSLGGVRSKCTWERSLQVWRCRHREGFERLEDGEEEEEALYPSKKLCGKILAGIELLAGIDLAQVFTDFRKRMLRRLGAKLEKAKVSGQAWHIYVWLVTLLMLAFTIQHAY